ncbi:MAG: substrate-binding domain-containing protein [Spirochaetes bacterium]|nr:substrate-binding domain-containing protein [Spirochaetota bacterium]
MLKIAVINGYNHWSHSLPNEYWVKILSGIHDIVSAEGLPLACLDLGDLAGRAWSASPFAGFIGAIPSSHAALGAEWARARKRVPCVSIMSCEDGDRVAYVGPDEALAMREIADHLAREGHASCFFAALSAERFSAARRASFLRFAGEKKIAAEALDYAPLYGKVRDRAPDEAARELLKMALRRRPRAIVFDSDFFASRFQRAAIAGGMRVPEDFALVGMNDAPEHPLKVPLSTIRHDGAMIGREAARLLLARLRGEPTRPRVLVASSLIIRRSSLGRSLLGGSPAQFREFVQAQIREHFAFPETLRLLPQTLAMTPATFSRRFKEAFGAGFVSHVNRHRIAQAAHLLASTDDSILTIALGTGFNSHTHFMTFFRREKGCTPSEFRAKRGLRWKKSLDRDGKELVAGRHERD